MERQWQWEAAHVIEHSHLAGVCPDGTLRLGKVVRNSTNGSVELGPRAPSDRVVRIAWMERHARQDLLRETANNLGLHKWMGSSRGGTRGGRRRPCFNS